MDYMEIDEHEKKNKTEFGLRIANLSILKKINQGHNKNLVLSPLVFHISLNMVASASTGRTLQQFLHFLQSESLTDLNAQSALFMELASTSDGGPIILILSNLYKAKAESVDFVNQGAQVLDEINSWAREVSGGHIDPFLPRDHKFTKDDIALLASAIYFKATWARKFDASSTKDDIFHLLNGQTVRVPFMRESHTRQFYRSFFYFQLLKMEYKKSPFEHKKYSMYIFLPHRKDGLPEMVQKFGSDPRFLLENVEVEQVLLDKLWVPKLKYECFMSATEIMKETGLDLPFDEKQAEITEMVETSPNYKNFYVSGATQKAYVEVNEEGTIATAISGAICFGSAAPPTVPPPPGPSFIADHPFMFMIKEEVSDITLFVGAALNPNK